ncbi:amidohydrolase family protein, partial [bacterium]|nr:amidohydrolase family protein [bacterium]
RETGARLHIAHVSTAGSVELVRRAKADGIAVTCETCPHYFSLTDDDVRSYDTSLRVNPPLRTAADVEAITAGLVDGTIDAIASDHAPHSLEEKQVEFDAAPPGMIGMETLLPVTLTHIVHTGVLALPDALRLLTSGPARAFGIPGGTIEVGAQADIVVFDPGAEWTVSADWFRSKSRNSPFIGRTLRGRVRMTVSRGKTVFEERTHDEGRAGDAHGSADPERDKLAVGV